MKISYNWLKELVDFDFDPQALAHRLTLIGIAVESIEPVAGILDNVVVGKIITAEPHHTAREITICRVELGKDIQMTVVCGAPNVKVGMKAPLALPGAILKDGTVIKSVEKYGTVSEAMLCSEAELGISDDHTGIMELEPTMKSGSDLRTVLNLDDYTFSFDLTPNRPDCLSAIGIAREISALSGSPVKRPPNEFKEIAEKAADVVSVTIDDPVGCPRYSARVIRGVKIGSSPWWIKQRLLASGIRSINNIVDITNYVMLEYGQPLHAFDFDKFDAPRVVVRRAHHDEIFRTLDGVERKLSDEMVLITDGVKPVAIAGIMGGEFSEVSEKTTNIMLESAYFTPSMIRRGRKHIGLTSESQTRFERGADPNIVTAALDRAASLMEKLASGKILSGIVDCYPQKINPIKMEVRPSRVNGILATDLSAPQMIDILDALEFKITPGKNITIEVPTFRPDVTREIDVIEEIARIYGYDKIPIVMQSGGKLVRARDKSLLFADKVRSTLVSQGFYEIVTNSIVDPKQIRLVDANVQCLEILNPISEDLKWLRPSLLPCLLNAVRENLSHQVRSVKVFEIGTIFTPRDGQLPIETQEFGLCLSGSDFGENWAFHPGAFSFFDLRGALESLSSLIDTDIEFAQMPLSVYEPDCSFSLLLHGQPFGHCGMVQNKLLRQFDIKSEVFATELDFSALDKSQKKAATYFQLPRYPFAERDIAIVVDERLKCQELLEGIRKSADETLKETIVFDVYRGKQVEPGKKSLAFRLVFQDESKTLTDAEIDNVFNKIVESLKVTFGAVLRA